MTLVIEAVGTRECGTLLPQHQKDAKPRLPQKARTAREYTLESDAACSIQSGKTKVSVHTADVLDREQAWPGLVVLS